ncbi:glycoside hydrolase family 2 TIM barrel-domain containing protein [Duganella sp. Root336D2]|uniref:glycoside hydrolase family 2 protein n=1 Tax=Duganella sp. Root336D2 TaxID=1736518 RepID=UPI0009E75659|nr:glycoside hydrolase family 2 TIM barrel-domain containing protein [Duganella sp. Root336D2]
MKPTLALISCALLAPLAAAAPPREAIALDADWLFHKVGDHGWQAVTLPHSYGAYRGPAWYSRTLHLSRVRNGQRHFLEFDGALLVTEAWINGQQAGRHAGGFARFRFDVTNLLRQGDNTLVLRVDNAPDAAVAPLAGDYTLSGGLYRKVRLVATSDLHFDMLDYGGPGVYFKPYAISHETASLAWTARVRNDRDRSARAVVTTRLRDAGQRIVASARKTVELPPRSAVEIDLQAVLPAPHLWQGTSDPYLYTSEAELAEEGGAGASLRDRLSFAAGIRDIRLDPERGLLLNGASYRVHGVNVHQTSLPGKGIAASDADIDADYRILSELGVTGLRYAHYQHPQRGYDLSDRAGWLVWTELPLTAAVNGSDDFLANSTQQLRELVRQNSNHPSVMLWGLGNEIYQSDAASARVLAKLQQIAHEEDPSRPTAYANCCAPIDGPQASHTDAVASNVYFGWYDGQFADLGPFLDANRTRRPATALAISEYGAGASALQQEDPPRRPQPGGRWHPEQYQALYHEAAWPQLAARPWLWASFVWVGFDFASAGRNEGDTPGFNDKGLVSFDRTIRKDAYFWYQANWASQPMAYITSRRHALRTQAATQVKVYSNQASARLRLNGVDLGQRPVAGHIATWQVELAEGANRLQVSAGGAADSVEWTFRPAPPAR